LRHQSPRSIHRGRSFGLRREEICHRYPSYSRHLLLRGHVTGEGDGQVLSVFTASAKSLRCRRLAGLHRRWRLLFEAARRSKFRRQGRLWERPPVVR